MAKVAVKNGMANGNDVGGANCYGSDREVLLIRPLQ